MMTIRNNCRRLRCSLERASGRTMVRAMSLAPLVITAVAAAQEAPPSPALRKSSSLMIGYVIMFLLLVAVIVVSLIPSKRGHQD